MANYRILLLCGCLFILISNCTKIEFPKDLDFPVVEILPAQPDSAAGVLLRAQVHHLGETPIQESYFQVYPAHIRQVRDEVKMRVPVDLVDQQEVQQFMDWEIYPGLEYVARMVINTGSEKIISDTVKFIGQGSAYQPWNFRSETLSYFSEPKIFVVDRKLYVLNSSGLLSYDFDQNAWAEVQNLPDYFTRLTYISTVASSAYFFGKSTYSSAEEIGLWRWTPNSSEIVRLADFQNINPPGLNYHYNGKTYLVTSRGRVYALQIPSSTTLELLGFLPNLDHTNQIYSTFLNGKIYVFFTNDEDDEGEEFQSYFLSFDPNSQVWEQLPPFPGINEEQPGPVNSIFWLAAHDSSIFLGNSFYTATNQGTQSFDGECWKYDPISQEWSFQGWNPFTGISARSSSVQIDNQYLNFFVTIDRQSHLLTFDPEKIKED